MSKVTITLELDRYICQELEDVRTMIKQLDFSDLPATTERMQKHANAMEKALYNYKDYMEDIRRVLKDKKVDSKNYGDDKDNEVILTSDEKLEKITEILKKKYQDNW